MNRIRLFLLKRNTLRQLRRQMYVLPHPFLMKESDLPLIAGWIKEASAKNAKHF